MATSTTSTNTIPYWGLFTGGNYFDYNPADTAAGQQFLSGIRKLDPNATFTQIQMGEGQSPYYQLQYNAKEPGVDLNAGDYTPLRDQNATYTGSGGNFAGQLKDPNAVSSSSTWGSYTSPDNIKPLGPDLLSILGPAAVLGSIWAFPALAGAMSGGAIGGAAGAAGTGAGGAAASDTSPMFDMGPWSGTGVGDMVPGTGLTDSLGAGAAGAGATALDTSGDSYLGLDGGPMQAVPPNPIADTLVSMGMDPLTAGTIASGLGGIAGKLPNILGKIPGLLGNGSGTGSGGSGGGGAGLISEGQKAPYSSLLQVLQKYYGKGITQ